MTSNKWTQLDIFEKSKCLENTPFFDANISMTHFYITETVLLSWLPPKHIHTFTQLHMIHQHVDIRLSHAYLCKIIICNICFPQSPQLSVDTTDPDLTSCFQDTVITWLSYGWLLLASPIYMKYLQKKPKICRLDTASALYRMKLVRRIAYTQLYESINVLCGEQWSRGRAPDGQSRGRWFNPTYRRFETWEISFIPHSKETLKAGCAYYL